MFGTSNNLFDSAFPNQQHSQMTKEEAQLKSKKENIIVSIRKNIRNNQIMKRRNLNMAETLPVNQSTEHMTPLQLQINLKRNFSITQLGELHECMKSENLQKMYYGIIGVRRILGASETQAPPIQEVIDARMLPEIIRFATQQQQQQMKLEAIWCLSLLVAGDFVQTQTVVQRTGLEFFVRLMQSNNSQIVEQSIWAVGNVAADRVIYRDKLIQYGAIDILCHLVRTSNISKIVTHGCWCLSNIIRLNPIPPSHVVQPVLVAMSKVIMDQKIIDIQTVKDILWSISYIIEIDEEKVQIFLNTGIIDRFCQILDCGINALVSAVLRNIGHICYGKEEFVELIIQKQIITRFNALMDVDNYRIRKQICWICSNVVVSSQSHLEYLFAQTQLIQKILDIFQSESPAEIRIDCGFVFANTVKLGNPVVFTQFFLRHKLIDSFLNIIQHNPNYSMVQMALKGINSSLKLGVDSKDYYGGNSATMRQFINKNGIEILENAQEHQNQSVFRLAAKILEGYFESADPLESTDPFKLKQ